MRQELKKKKSHGFLSTSTIGLPAQGMHLGSFSECFLFSVDEGQDPLKGPQTAMKQHAVMRQIADELYRQQTILRGGRQSCLKDAF